MFPATVRRPRWRHAAGWIGSRGHSAGRHAAWRVGAWRVGSWRCSVGRRWHSTSWWWTILALRWRRSISWRVGLSITSSRAWRSTTGALSTVNESSILHLHLNATSLIDALVHQAFSRHVSIHNAKALNLIHSRLALPKRFPVINALVLPRSQSPVHVDHEVSISLALPRHVLHLLLCAHSWTIAVVARLRVASGRAVVVLSAIARGWRS
mmetsp:Transcript_608/g.1245  ORF Transcript_608/g.1245 Transcript_608/m.1245 type:complete len:210 (-) Transcript_608:109-738(-)